MSVKIYTAFRVPLNRLEKFIKRAQKLIILRTVEYIKSLLLGAKPEEDTAGLFQRLTEYEHNLFRGFVGHGVTEEEFPAVHTKYIKEIWLYRILLHARVASEENARVANLDADLSIYIHEEFAYIIPYLHSAASLKVQDFPKWCKDYAYFDNTDQPAGISNAEWERRGRMWKKIAGDETRNVLYNVVLLRAQPGKREIGAVQDLSSVLKFLPIARSAALVADMESYFAARDFLDKQKAALYTARNPQGAKKLLEKWVKVDEDKGARCSEESTETETKDEE